MSPRGSTLAKKTSVSLGTALDIVHVAALKKRLATALDKALPVVLVAEKVEKADTAGLQLIYAFIQKVNQKGFQVSWQKPTDSLLQTSEILGLSEVLKLN